MFRLASTVRGLRARARATRAYSTMDAVRAWLGGVTGASTNPLASKDLSLEDFVNLLERAETERGAPSSEETSAPRAHAAEISFPIAEAKEIVRKMRDDERVDPGGTPLARRRELGDRARVDELFKTHALARAIARRCAEMGRVPTSPEELAEALKAGDDGMSKEERAREARAMRGAFPSNRPCPCGSMKKFKRCCGAD